MYISLRVNLNARCYKVTQCIHRYVYISRNVTKLLNVYISACTFQGKLMQSYGMCISTRVDLKEGWYKVTECIYQCVYISGKVVIKWCSVHITACASQGKLLYSYVMYISLRVHLKDSCFKATEGIYITACRCFFKLTECIYHCVTNYNVHRRLLIFPSGGFSRHINCTVLYPVFYSDGS